MNGESAILERWNSVRGACRDDQIDATDARFAEEMGYNGLAAVYAMLDGLAKAVRLGRQPTPIEISAQLRSVAAILNGEAERDLKERVDGRLTLPGVKLAGVAPRSITAGTDRAAAA